MLTFVVTVYFVVLAFLVFGDGYNIKVLFKTFDSVYFVMVQVLFFFFVLVLFQNISRTFPCRSTAREPPGGHKSRRGGSVRTVLVWIQNRIPNTFYFVKEAYAYCDLAPS